MDYKGVRIRTTKAIKNGLGEISAGRLGFVTSIGRKGLSIDLDRCGYTKQ